MPSGKRAARQQANRTRILAAAEQEFTEVGYRGAKVDSIAARAQLTRGAVYSNFSSKLALGLTVAAQKLGDGTEKGQEKATRDGLVAALAHAWIAHLPVGGSDLDHPILALPSDLYSEIREDKDLRDAHAELLKLDAVLLAHVLEHLGPEQSTARQVRAASALLAVLHAATTLSASAPGFFDPFDVVTAAKALAHTDFADQWTPPDSSILPRVEEVGVPWTPPESVDLITGSAVCWPDSGLIAVVGLRQASSVEQAIRAVDPDTSITVILVTDDWGQRGPLAAMVLTRLLPNLRPYASGSLFDRISVVLDSEGECAKAAGLRSVTDDTNLALGVDQGSITHRATGAAAIHVVAKAWNSRKPGKPFSSESNPPVDAI